MELEGFLAYVATLIAVRGVYELWQRRMAPPAAYRTADAAGRLVAGILGRRKA